MAGKLTRNLQTHQIEKMNKMFRVKIQEAFEANDYERNPSILLFVRRPTRSGIGHQQLGNVGYLGSRYILQHFHQLLVNPELIDGESLLLQLFVFLLYFFGESLHFDGFSGQICVALFQIMFDLNYG